MDKDFWRNMKIITFLSLILTLILGSDIPWKELHTICFSFPIAKSILYDISDGVFYSMILVWCIDRIQLNETEKKEAKQRVLLYNKMAPILTKYYDFYLFLYIATRNKPVKSNDNVLESLYYCKEEFIAQIYNTDPFYKDGYYVDPIKLEAQIALMNTPSNTPQVMEQITKMSTNLPWYKCWYKDGTEFYNNILQIERDYAFLFPNELLELLDRLLNIVGAQRYMDDFVEGKIQPECLHHIFPMPQFPTNFFVDAYKIEEILMLLDEIMLSIEKDSEINLRRRELDFFNERNVCPTIGYSCDNIDANM